MGKGGGGGSWLTSVKRAFRSPSKDTENNRKSTRRKEDQSQEDQDNEDVKKKDKRRWIFKKLSVTQEKVSHPKVATSKATCDAVGGRDGNANVVAYNVSAAAEAEQQRNAIAMAVATAAAAEAAVATVKAAAEVARLSRPLAISNYCAREHYAAIVIQTAFRGYLARRALRALKGLVKLQALVRGHNVRKQAKMTLKCMQALVRVQARVLDQRMRLSSHDGSRQSTFSDTNSMLKSRYRQDILDRRSMSRDGSSIADDWDERPHTIEEVKAMLQHRKDTALKREKTLSQAFSQQIWRTGRSPSIGSEGELLQERPQWLDRWMAAKPWNRNTINSRARASTDHRDSIKTVEIDTSQPYSYLAPNFRRTSNNQFQAANPYHQRIPNSHSNVSPLHGAHQTTNPYRHSPITPSPSKSRPIQVRSASPRCQREDRSCSSSQTPSLRSNYYYSGNLNQHGKSGASGSSTLPNYMAATESAKARLRSQSAPRQRPSTPERDRIGSAKKRLSFPAPDPCGVGMGYNGGGGGNYYGNGLKSPSFKSVSHFGGLEEQSNYSSCCTESLGGEFSPSSTTDLRRWLR